MWVFFYAKPMKRTTGRAKACAVIFMLQWMQRGERMIEVAVGIAMREDGTVLVGQRKPEAIHGGKWEFPGGKIEPGETPKEALIREWQEELAANLRAVQPWKRVDVAYGERKVALFLLFCQSLGEITPNVYQQVAWKQPKELLEMDLLEGDRLFLSDLIQWEVSSDRPGVLHFLDWYQIHARELPWRETTDPYRIWLSEIMLQQTRVETVKDYYRRFLIRFPTVENLANASEETVLKAWEGLGYYSRARNLHRCAKEISKRGGIFPRTQKELLALPGIGVYTSGAVASFAFGERVPAVDGNVLRVAARWFGIWEDIMKPKTRTLITERIAEILPMDTASFNQGMMELGATICTPKNPACGRCPLESDCYARWHWEQDELPIKSKKKKPKHVEVAVGWIHVEDRVMLVKRPGEGLLAGLWGLPVGEGETQEEALRALLDYMDEMFDLQVGPGRKGHSAEHIFTHRVWAMTGYHFEVSESPAVEYPVNRILKLEEFDQLAIPTAFQKIIKKGSR